MNKNVVKVIKRDKIEEDEEIKNVVNSLKSERIIQSDLVNAVNDWISERRTTSRMEKIFSGNKISEWEILLKTSIQPMR